MSMNRIDAIEDIMGEITDEIVVTSCGMISRETYHIKDRDRNFYVMGSMGATLGIAIGIALNKPNDRVIVICGDGEILMSLGTLALFKKLNLPNLFLHILDNNEYASTGGQKTISDVVDFKSIGGNKCNIIKVEGGNSDVGRIPIPHEKIKERFMNAINGLQ